MLRAHLVGVDDASEERLAGVAAHAAVVEVRHGVVAAHGAVDGGLGGDLQLGRAHRRRLRGRVVVGLGRARGDTGTARGGSDITWGPTRDGHEVT